MLPKRKLSRSSILFSILTTLGAMFIVGFGAVVLLPTKVLSLLQTSILLGPMLGAILVFGVIGLIARLVFNNYISQEAVGKKWNVLHAAIWPMGIVLFPLMLIFSLSMLQKVSFVSVLIHSAWPLGLIISVVVTAVLFPIFMHGIKSNTQKKSFTHILIIPTIIIFIATIVFLVGFSIDIGSQFSSFFALGAFSTPLAVGVVFLGLLATLFVPLILINKFIDQPMQYTREGDEDVIKKPRLSKVFKTNPNPSFPYRRSSFEDSLEDSLEGQYKGPTEIGDC